MLCFSPRGSRWSTRVQTTTEALFCSGELKNAISSCGILGMEMDGGSDPMRGTEPVVGSVFGEKSSQIVAFHAINRVNFAHRVAFWGHRGTRPRSSWGHG